ncbi:hypothetical protein BDW02DRAFT_573611, partial [Decorospora gaudefroyi]
MLRNLLVVLQLRYALASVQLGLPHDVLNITQTSGAAVSPPLTVTYTITEPSILSCQLRRAPFTASSYRRQTPLRL